MEIGNPLNSLDIQLQLMQRRIKKLPAKAKDEFEESIGVARQVARLDHIITPVPAGHPAAAAGTETREPQRHRARVGFLSRSGNQGS